MNCTVRSLSVVQCQLGEGLLWQAESDRLLMTDILAQKLIAIDIDALSKQEWLMPEPIGWAMLTRNPGLYVVGLKSGIALFDSSESQSLRWLDQTFPGSGECRLNDACTDIAGRVWYGSMSAVDGRRKVGRLASFDVKQGVVIHDEGFTVTNGPVINAAQSALFFNDTLTQRVYQYDLNVKHGLVSNRRLFADVSQEGGYPDGMCFDLQGNLWVALWGAGKVICLNTEGEKINEVLIPAPHVSNVCLAGQNRDRMLVSTARVELSQPQLERYPGSGSLFEIIGHGAKGLPALPVNLG